MPIKKEPELLVQDPVAETPEPTMIDLPTPEDLPIIFPVVVLPIL